MMNLKIRLIVSCFSVVTLFPTVPRIPAHAQIIISSVEQLSASEQTALKNGQTVVTGENGKYVARVLIEASPAAVWSVLTDYNNLAQFVPNVVASQLIEANGNRKVVEQVSERQVFGMNVRSRLRTENIETHQQRIDFRLIDGDLQTLQGYWEIEPTSASGGTTAQVLLTHVVEAQPTPGIPPGIFYAIFKEALNPTLNAIRQEAEQR